ncbi:MAG: hypothetical protein R6V04_13440 [bacterium]
METKEFSLKNNIFDFIKSYFTYLWPYLLIFIAVIVQILQFDFTYKMEAAILLFSIILLLIVGIGIFFFKKFKNIRYIISPDLIQVFDYSRGKVTDYPFSDLEDVKFPKTKDMKKMGKQYFYLKFKHKKKLVFTSILPYYVEIRDFLTEIVKKKGYLET